MNSEFCLGTDVVEVARIHRLIRRDRFLDRIFTQQEIRYCQKKKNSAQHFAVRFAAKEAVWKAIASLTQSVRIAHKEISVGRMTNGQPYVRLSARLKKFEPNISLSLSHTKQYALAVALFQSKAPDG